VWVQDIGPARGGSGLAHLDPLGLMVRLYAGLFTEPGDAIDPTLMQALDALLASYSGDFTLDGSVREVDLLGQYGDPLSAKAGYMLQSGTEYRVMTSRPAAHRQRSLGPGGIDGQARRPRRRPLLRRLRHVRRRAGPRQHRRRPALLDFTDITQSAMARQGGLRDGPHRVDVVLQPGPAANAAHGLLSALPRGDVLLTYCRGTTLGAPAACLNGKQVNYDGTRGNDGAFTFAVSGQANAYGLEWGKLLTAGMRTDTAATTGTGSTPRPRRRSGRRRTSRSSRSPAPTSP
jgi:hypothetical protein